MQNANGLITEALYILFATCRWKFYTMTNRGNFPNTSYNKKGTATLLPPARSGGDNSSMLYNDKHKYFEWSNKERKWFRGFEPQYQKFTFIHAKPAKRLGLTLPANWAVSLLPHRTHQVTTRATSLGCHTGTLPTSNNQTSSSYSTRIIKQQNFLTMSQS